MLAFTGKLDNLGVMRLCCGFFISTLISFTDGRMRGRNQGLERL